MSQLTHIFVNGNREIYRRIYKAGEQVPHIPLGAVVRFERDDYSDTALNHDEQLFQEQENRKKNWLNWSIRGKNKSSPNAKTYICRYKVEDIVCDLDRNYITYFTEFESETRR